MSWRTVGPSPRHPDDEDGHAEVGLVIAFALALGWWMGVASTLLTIWWLA